MKSEPVRIPVIVHTNTFYNSFNEDYGESWDSCYDSKSDGENSSSSLEVLTTPGQIDSVECKWTDCGKIFAHLDDLAAHVTSFHANSGPGGLFFCGWQGCGRGNRGFNARYKMLVHVRTHTNEKPHRCCQCDKSFSRAENLKIHSRSHTGERPYVCPVIGCGKAYSNSSDRFKHTRTHAVDKPYMCKVPGCGKRYTDPSSLRKHVKTFRHTQQTKQEVFKMDEEIEHEQIVPETETESLAKDGSQMYRYYSTTQDSSDLRYKWFRNWFGMDWSHSDPQGLDLKFRNYHHQLQQQDVPLDLTIHK